VSTETVAPVQEAPAKAKLAAPPMTSAARPDFKAAQPTTTFAGSAIPPLQTGLPKLTQSLCPECKGAATIEARLFEEEGKVWMEKTCSQHGYFRDLYYSDVKLYLKAEQWQFGDGRGLMNPAVPEATRCPADCGLCSMHTSHTGLANLDLTNRCNLTCPICFANANTSGTLYEPSLEQVRGMLQALRDEKPVAGRIVQFSGGEPTLYPQFFEACSLARDMGFSHVQAATNGILLADPDFARQAKQAGLTTLYLQFDGLTDDVYLRTRGQRLAATKMQVIANARAVGMKIVLVPTIVRGLNDQQIGDIMRLAVKNADVVTGLTFQPVTFTGRLNRNELAAKRFTQADVAHAIAEQSGYTDAYHDWFPLSCVQPFSMLISALRGELTVHLSCHPHCSLGTYLFVDEATHEAVPITRFVDIGAMLQDIYDLARQTANSRIKLWSKLKIWSKLQKHFKPQFAPRGLDFQRFVQTLQGFTDKKLGRDGMDGKFTYRAILVSAMHFMDSYNYDVERVRRCVIHYAAPDGRIYPFCAYNSGPVFREQVEKQFSVPFDREAEAGLAAGNGNGCGGCGAGKDAAAPPARTAPFKP
jgi:uncharacterized radical SAM superfamily Fe-S cluster-containing enzyme